MSVSTATRNIVDFRSGLKYTIKMKDDTTFPLWNDAEVLYFHFNSANGGFATLPMRRVVRTFEQEFKGVPGTVLACTMPNVGATRWRVPGYKCLGCAKTYFTARQEDLKHECMNHGGIISDKA